MKKYITSKHDTMGGAPCITGTRIPIAVIVQRLKEVGLLRVFMMAILGYH
ncbi:DUF433 domain-containing protein [Candidatus Daviesbacteria bacterium]|nr:DUF433 domain-containing protein [Candidatus Daviesbacteria bacterium]